ncbi:hypothetical protein [Saccharicrinis aurantiacus]|uniref:hypothetical protein n=1 Tax=Saccharicrinis aurantiacus TaxID=1849719 RepID=UPI0011152512|nr:hypothetical protein [Saccharicrinis aurantiacus]
MYNVNIDYVNLPEIDGTEMYNDSLIIAFYESFNKDTLTVSINQKHFKTMFLTTDERTGDAGYLQTIKYKDVKNIGLRINSGKLICIEPPKIHYNIQLMYLDSTATVRFHRKLPACY